MKLKHKDLNPECSCATKDRLAEMETLLLATESAVLEVNNELAHHKRALRLACRPKSSGPREPTWYLYLAKKKGKGVVAIKGRSCEACIQYNDHDFSTKGGCMCFLLIDEWFFHRDFENDCPYFKPSQGPGSG